jgi:ATP-dependent Lhr-like helicase
MWEMGEHMELHPRVEELVRERFPSLSLPQRLAIPKILEGKNVLVIARTGSGKTEAALLPIFSLLAKREGSGINVLYIAPLRALNRDLLERIRWWSERLDITAEVRHGDTSAGERRKQALTPPRILITTPETLQALLIGKIMRNHLKGVEYVIVDEIHELASDKRGLQLSLGLERLAEVTQTKFLRIGLSATVGSPQEVASFLGKDVLIIDAVEEKRFEIEVEYPRGQDVELAEKLHTTPDTAGRIKRILQLLERHESVLVFVNTREMAETLSSRFRLLSDAIDVHHSSLAKQLRIDTEKKFKTQKIKSIVCTSSLELGIDVGSVDLVVQYMSPRQVARLLQRAGRSGHRREETVRCKIIATTPDDIAESSVIVRKALEGELEGIRIYRNALDVLAHQIVGMALEYYECETEHAFKIVKRAYPYRELPYEKFLAVCNFLKSLRLLSVSEDGTQMRRKKSNFPFYYGKLSMIPDTRQYRIIEVGTNTFIGVLDEEFITTQIDIGGTFVVKGRTWNLLDIKDDVVLVSESKALSNAPSWEGELIPVPFEVAQGVAGARLEGVVAEADEEAGEIFRNYVEEQKKFFLPQKDEIVFEVLRSHVILHCCYGSLVNETMGRLIATLLTAKLGSSVGMFSDPYRILFSFPIVPDVEGIKEILASTNPEHIQTILEITLKRSSLFSWKLGQVAQRFGAISKDAEAMHFRRLIYAYEDTPLFEETINEIMVEKLDIAKTKRIFEGIQKSEIRLTVVKTKKPSPFARPILERGSSDLIYPERPEEEILELLKKRLSKRKVRLLCCFCGSVQATTSITDMEEFPKCHKCKARFLTFVRVQDTETGTLVKKSVRNLKLTRDEEKRVAEAKRKADLVLGYGKNAVLALSGRGIGVTTAKRILEKSLTPTSLLKNILEAERTYARTRRFWD